MQRGHHWNDKELFLTRLAPEVREWLEALVGNFSIEESTIALRLYIAGEAPNSALALANLGAIIAEFPNERLHLEVVDVLKDPMRAIADAIIVTPTLMRMAPSPAKMIVGNLNDRAKVVAALGLGEKKP
jgi:circadian clock protein KaiB